MWREAKADAIVSSIKGLVGGAAPTDTAFFDVCPVSGRAHDPWEQSFGHVDPWGDPGGISAFDPQYRVRNQLKSTVLKVLCKAAGMHEISWSAADRTLLGGLDEKNFRTLDENELKAEWRRAQQQAGTRFILTPGCSVPNDSTDAELNRLVTVLGA